MAVLTSNIRYCRRGSSFCYKESLKFLDLDEPYPLSGFLGVKLNVLRRVPLKIVILNRMIQKSFQNT